MTPLDTNTYQATFVKHLAVFTFEVVCAQLIGNQLFVKSKLLTIGVDPQFQLFFTHISIIGNIDKTVNIVHCLLKFTYSNNNLFITFTTYCDLNIMSDNTGTLYISIELFIHQLTIYLCTL